MAGYDVERYLNVRSATGATFGPGGERLAFLMDTTGVSQVWTLDAPGAWPDQRTFFDERVTFADWSPARQELAFGMDEGGNERAQLFRLSLVGGRDGGAGRGGDGDTVDQDGEVGPDDPRSAAGAGDGVEVHPLTAMPDAKHRWGGWSNDGERVAFASNRRDEAVFDVYVQGRDERGDDARLVYEGDGWYSVGGWSPDDSRLILHRAHSSFDHDVYVLDVDGGDRTHLTPHEGRIRYRSVEWGPDGDVLYLVTDEGADTLSLARLTLDGDLALVEEGGDWNVDGVALDQDTGRFVYSRNVDGYTELTVAELTGATAYRKVPGPDLPGGLAGGVDFGPDGERFAITATGRTENANVHVVDVDWSTDTDDGAGSAADDGAGATADDGTGSGVTGATRWTRAATAGIPRASFVEPELVHYETFDGREIPAFLSLPDEPGGRGEHDERDERDATEGDGEVPVVVNFHGGPESQHRPSFAAVAQYFLDRGYAVFEPNVRGSTGYGRAFTHLDDVERRMDSVKDGRAGVEWLHDHPAVDPDRVVAMGGSYGGFMVLASLTEYPDLWAAGVDIVGIANFVTFLENTGDWRRELREAEYGSLEADREFLESISPVNRADRIEAPLFVAHGANDPRVPVGEAEQIAEAVRERDVPVEVLVFEDEGHGFSKLENRIEAYTAIVEFLDEHV